MTRSPQKIAVIGAGISGLACAAALSAHGHRVDIFEKSRGPAGRMSTRRGEDHAPVGHPNDEKIAWQCDHGAQYFTARDPRFRAELDRWTTAGVAALWQGRMASVDASGWSAPASDTQRFVGIPRMTSPAAWVLQDLGGTTGFYPQHTVHSVERAPSGWCVSTAEQGLAGAHYDALMIAVPAPQARVLLAPVAPAAAATAAGVVMQGSWALMLRYDAPVALPCDGAFINTGPLRWIARDSSKPGRTGHETWLLHASAEWSEAHMEDDAGSVGLALLAAFVALGGHPQPRAVSAHRWRYADTAPGTGTAPSGHWWDPEQQLGMCGDWLNGGKVEGAWLSGHLLANALST